jgi:hypothetical protein
MNPPPGSRRTKAVAAAAIPALAGAWLVYSYASDKTFDWRLFRGPVAGSPEPVGAHPSLRHLLSQTLSGYATVMPLGRAAEMARPYLIASRDIAPFACQVSAAIAERIYGCRLPAKRHLDQAEPSTAAFLDGVSFTARPNRDAPIHRIHVPERIRQGTIPKLGDHRDSNRIRVFRFSRSVAGGGNTGAAALVLTQVFGLPIEDATGLRGAERGSL